MQIYRVIIENGSPGTHVLESLQRGVTIPSINQPVRTVQIRGINYFPDKKQAVFEVGVVGVYRSFIMIYTIIIIVVLIIVISSDNSSSSCCFSSSYEKNEKEKNFVITFFFTLAAVNRLLASVLFKRIT